MFAVRLYIFFTILKGVKDVARGNATRNKTSQSDSAFNWGLFSNIAPVVVTAHIVVRSMPKRALLGVTPPHLRTRQIMYRWIPWDVYLMKNNVCQSDYN